MNFQGKKVLVTGADGFIGSHLVEMLIKKGADVTALAQYNSFNNWGWLDYLDSQIKNDIRVVTGDVREYDGIKKIVEGNQIVFHLAALIAIPYSYQSPMAYIKTNIEGSANILEASLSTGVERVIHTSTSEVYGSALYVPIDEKHPLQGQSPYSASKIGADKIAESYFKSFELPVTTVRPFNTYGPRQSMRAVIPTIIAQIANGNRLIKLGDLTPTRDFNYVKDTANAFIAAASSHQTIGETVNAGSGKEISIGELVNQIIKLMGYQVTIEQDEKRLRPQNSEVNRLLADATLLQNLTGWKPEYTLEEGLKETIQWIENNLHFFKTDIYNV